MSASRNGDHVREPGATFEYEVRFEWGPYTECRRMNRIAPIADFVVEKLANIGVIDVDEGRPEPDVARITIERVTAETEEEPGNGSGE